MTRFVLPHMLAKKKGVIINMSSFSAVMPTALLTQYSATKVSSQLEPVAASWIQLQPAGAVPPQSGHSNSAASATGWLQVNTNHWMHVFDRFVLLLVFAVTGVCVLNLT